MIGGVVEMPKKRWHQPPGERNELAEMAPPPLQVDLFQREGQEGQTRPAPRTAASRFSWVGQPAVTATPACAMRFG